MALTPGADRVSVTVRVTLRSRLKFPAPVWRNTCTSTGPADSPGRFGASAVAAVGNGTVSVLPVGPVARTCASSTPPPTKFATGSPNPRSAKPLPVTVKLAAGAARSIELGVMGRAAGGGRVTVPGRLKLPAPVWREGRPSTGTADSTGRAGVFGRGVVAGGDGT